MRRAQNTADTLSFLINKLAIPTKLIAAKLRVKLLCHMTRHKTTELVCHNLIAITGEASDI